MSAGLRKIILPDGTIQWEKNYTKGWAEHQYFMSSYGHKENPRNVFISPEEYMEEDFINACNRIGVENSERFLPVWKTQKEN